MNTGVKEKTVTLPDDLIMALIFLEGGAVYKCNLYQKNAPPEHCHDSSPGEKAAEWCSQMSEPKAHESESRTLTTNLSKRLNHFTLISTLKNKLNF